MRHSLIFTAIGLIAVTVCLLGCTAQQKAVQAAENRVDVEAALDVYDNQLVRPGEPHAVLSAQPRPIDERAVFSPYLLREINGKRVERTPHSFTRAMPLPRDLAFSEMKVPTGRHDLVIFGGGLRGRSTKLSRVEFEAGKRYVIVQVMALAPEKTVGIHISEYRQDKRFLPHEKDYYIIGRRISDVVELGDSKVLDMQAAKP